MLPPGGTDKQLGQLIKKGANVDAPGKYGKRPLMYAAEAGNTNIVISLLSYGAEVNARTEKETPLFYAVRSESVEVVKYLLANKADKAHKNSAGMTASQVAAEKKNQTIIDLLK